MSEKLYRILERLAEMFPKQNYQSKLDAYLASKYVKSIGDVEYWSRRFDQEQTARII